MKTLSKVIMALSLVALPVTASAAEYALDTAHTHVGFKVRHLATNVQGNFNTFDGTFTFDEKNLSKASGTIVVDTASIDTNHPKRDGHLKSADFFEVEKYPKMTFNIKKAEKTKAGIKIHGDLTIRDVTKPVVLDGKYLGTMKDPWGNTVASFEAGTKINRKDYGLNWNKALEAGGFLVGDEVEITLHVEANPKPADKK